MASPSVSRSPASTGFAPNRLRPKTLCLADKIERQVLAIREKKFADLGLVMRIQLGVSDDSAYFQSQANDHLKEITKIQGLTFEWNGSCRPKISEVLDGQSGLRQFIFPDLWAKLPDIPDPRYRKLHVLDPDPPRIPQNLELFASGVVIHRDGTKFYCLQPVLQIAIQPFGVSTFLLLHGRANPWDGKHAALLVESRKKGHAMAFLVGGKLDFS
jgi:hypothetical protein